MKKEMKDRLEAAGWRVGTVAEFLGLDALDIAIIEIRVELAEALRKRRAKRRVSQAILAERLGSSQSRVAKMEAGDPTVSIDLLVRSLLASGTSSSEIGRAFAVAGKRAARMSR